MLRDLDYWRAARFRSGAGKGHYESWFLRANHPHSKDAFWIRYTIFAPKGRPAEARGELWAVYFESSSARIYSAKRVVAIGDCRFSSEGLDIAIGDATLTGTRLRGGATRGDSLYWDLTYEGQCTHPLLLLPDYLYEACWPKAKAVSQQPIAVFRGTLEINGRQLCVDDWVGSENHNWGSRHTDSYLWGQVCGFDNDPDACFEAATARLKFGPITTPALTVAVLRVAGNEYRLNSPVRALLARADSGLFHWRFATRHGDVAMQAEFSATPGDFVGLRYDNPPGGSLNCLNSKVARCVLRLRRPGRDEIVLVSSHRAAFEVLTR